MDMNAIIAAYLSTKEAEKAAKKEAEKLSKLILEFAGSNTVFSTDDFTVMIDKRTRSGIDTEKLYSDFPDIKDVYNKTTTYSVIIAKEKTESGKNVA